MPDTSGMDAVGVHDDPSILSGDLVRDLVTRNEEAIEALLARLGDAEHLAAVAEQSVREHPAFALLEADEAARLVPGPAEPTAVDGGRPLTTVVRRPMPPASATDRPGGSSTPPVNGSGQPARSLAGRITVSHWWWRVGIALVAVALVILKVG